MKSARNKSSRNRRGAVLIVSMMFLIIFSTLALNIATMSGSNLQIADNQHKADCARACAESGLEVVRYWMGQIAVPGTTEPSLRFYEVVNSIQSELASNNISNISTTFSGDGLTLPGVTLDSGEQQSFSAVLSPSMTDPDVIQLEVTGTYGSVSRKIAVDYRFSTRAHTVFDFGVATKGPLSLAGNILLDGATVEVDSDVYIESESSSLALSIIGNSQIAGDVSIVNPVATVDLQGGQAGIGGETGQAAIDNHVSFGVPPSEFPVPTPSYFEPFITSTMDPNTDTSADVTLENIRIPANINPTFSGSATIRGVVFIESPNVVLFTGSADVTGIIVGDGDITDNSATNQISFVGNVSSHPLSELPQEEQFAEFRDETGTFIMAPGFHISFGGSFDALCGAIAGNGIEFYGNAGGTIQGSVLNYSDEQMNLTGNSDLFFNRSGLTEAPAGFVPELILEYDPESYSEPML
ncbi:MAG: pilus assembly PilX N-terminal domain-containing protein [Phycisphaerales bacterium]|nr:MAG: pilus assembly PilX N-terminal domain-containing protein [Phycisphaerales bacterium]